MSAFPIPLRLGSPGDFTLAREFFAAALFNNAEVCRVLKLDDMSDLGRVAWDSLDPKTISPQLGWCLQIFVRGARRPVEECLAVCGAEVAAALQSLGLIAGSEPQSDVVGCPVWLYPVDGFLVASDRRDLPLGEGLEPPSDVVFPAIYAGTLRFLQLMPVRPCDDALDMCGGSGIGALHLSRTARRAATADVTERSAFFAEFNSRLNGVLLRSYCGDLYAPLAGAQFDLITAHPPFVPARGANMVYRDGGETGEDIIQGIIEGLPAHLRPGGTAVILCVARDTETHTFEQRALEWLGPARGEFDLLFGCEKLLSVEDVVESMRRHGQNLDGAAFQEMVARLRGCGTRQFVYGTLFVRRTDAAAPPPLRIRMTPAARASDFERLFAWRLRGWQPGFGEWLAQSRPRLAPGLGLTVRHVVRNGELTPVEFVFRIEAGFQCALKPDGWVAPLVARCQGVETVRSIFENLCAAGELPDGFKLKDFLELVRLMIQQGFLEVDE